MGRMSIQYTAGFFDGEGAVTISYHGGSYKWWRVQVIVGQNDPTPLKLLQKRWGGAVSKRKTANGLDTYCWQLSIAQADSFLQAIRPYLIVKADVVDIALEFRKGVGKHKGRGGMPPEEHQRRLDLRDRLRARVALRGRGAI